MSKFKILFKMTGSIACFKACQLVSKLVQNNYEVQVVATTSALQFVGNATIEGLTGKPVITDLFACGNIMDHIHLDRWADLVIVAPATAHFINKSSAGICDDLTSTLFLAHDFKKPYLIAPAMNEWMYKNPITQNSIKNLKNLGLEILPTDTGILACGETGPGRLLDPEVIYEKISNYFETLSKTPTVRSPEAGLIATGVSEIRVLVTTGGTTIPIDDVRYIGNSSTGKTGVQIAENLRDWGIPVTLVRSETSPTTGGMLHQLHFRTFSDLAEVLQQELSERSYTHIIHLAAVSDYEVSAIKIGSKISESDFKKLPSGQDRISLELKPTFKIVNELRDYSMNKDIKIIAFKLTSNASSLERERAVQKLITASHVEWVVHNDLSEIKKESGQHIFSIYSSDANKNIKNVEICHNVETLSEKLYDIILRDGRAL